MFAGILKLMPVFSTLLRLLLSVVLILNGAGTAVAAARMQLEQVAPAAQRMVVATSVAAAGTEPPCHHPPMVSAVAHADVSSPAAKAVGHARTRVLDCCKPGNCEGSCAYPVAGLAFNPVVHHPSHGHADMAWTEVGGHVEPSLPDLIRPPIG